MDTLDPETIKNLTANTQGLKLSIYLPTHPQSAPEMVQQDRTRFKNLLQQAKEELQKLGEDQKQIDTYLNAGLELYDDLDFWRNQKLSLALFINAAGDRQHFKLPIEIGEHMAVAGKYYLAPLLALVQEDQTFFIVSLNRNQPRLYQANRFGWEELEGYLPGSYDEALRIDEHATQSRFHPGRGGPTGNAFGHGGDKDEINEDLKRYLHLIDQGIHKAAGQPGKTSVVLAGTAEMIGHFREVAKYHPIYEESLIGNWEQASGDELHAMAWPLIENTYDLQRQAITDKVAQLTQTTPNLVATHITQIMEAAKSGRVDTLLVKMSLRTADSVRNKLEQVSKLIPPRGNLGRLTNLVAIESWRQRGAVHAVAEQDLPPNVQLCAILRY